MINWPTEPTKIIGMQGSKRDHGQQDQGGQAGTKIAKAKINTRRIGYRQQPARGLRANTTGKITTGRRSKRAPTCPLRMAAPGRPAPSRSGLHGNSPSLWAVLHAISAHGHCANVGPSPSVAGGDSAILATRAISAVMDGRSTAGGQQGRAGTGCSARRGFEGHRCWSGRPLVLMIGYAWPLLVWWVREVCRPVPR